MRSILIIALAAPALTLGGCGGTLNRSVDSVQQPVVIRTDYVFDVQTARDGGLAAGEDQRLAGWLSAMRLGYGDRVAIDAEPGHAAARDQVAAEAARFGLLVDDRAPITTAPLVSGTVRVVVSRTVARVPRCPDYSRMGQPEFNSNSSSNYGCATNSNVAAMVANPLDLVRGQPGADTADTATLSKAVGTYRRALPTGAGGLKSETTGNK
ncbi:CpaD family pilus assembly lipoprotein [uncultured Sphingomonas sp.]|uniref:CpaD family pilus assembly lipoprotein n=1 Tax=uncultured Sphingomonas sp. TaxID=158754 RepID=UPI0035CB8BDE